MLVSPASPPAGQRHVCAARQALKRLGFKVRLGRAVSQRYGYLAGTDRERTRDLENAFLDPAIKGIFCTRGGYGTSRLLEHFDLRLAHRHPKVLLGFSDITVLHLALQSIGIVSFWGPMPAASTGLNGFSASWLSRAIMQQAPLGRVPLDCQSPAGVLRKGKAAGRLTGGTITLLAASLGTAYEVQTKGRIVFLEEINEEPYRIDRMLTQLLAAGKLSDAAGIVLGIFQDCAPRLFTGKDGLSLEKMFADRLRPLGIPIFSGLAIGHMADQVTLPYGVTARIDAGKCVLEILEPGVN